MSAVPALICAGFHRSGTSLTAKRLQQGGLMLGTHLLPAHPSNPEGHFEDIRVIEFNDAWLLRQGTNWLFHDDVPLQHDASLLADIHGYAEERDAMSAPWAVKDPRITLALPAWQEALGDRGRFLLVVRHWAECAQSLFQRHSRELAHNLYPPDDAGNLNFLPWREPALVHQAWYAYNRRVLEFAALNPDRVALVTTRAIAELGDLSSLVSDRLGVSLELPHARTGLMPGMLSRRVREAVIAPLPLWLRESLDGLWRDLLAICDLRTPDESVDWDARRAPAWVRDGINQSLRAHFRGNPAITPAPPIAPKSASDEARSTLALLPLLPRGQRTLRALAAARLAFEAGQLDAAEALLLAALASGAPSFRLNQLLGDIANARHQPDQALEHYRDAARLRSSDALVMRMARCHIARRHWQQALDLLEPLLVLKPHDVGARLARARCLEKAEGAEVAVASLLDLPDPDLGVLTTQAKMTMAFDVQRGMKLYRETVQTRLEQQSLPDWLAGVCRTLPSPAAWDSLVESLYRNWLDLMGPEALHRKLGLEDLPRLDAPAVDAESGVAPAPLLVGGIGGSGQVALVRLLRHLGWFFGDMADDHGGSVALTQTLCRPELLGRDGDDTAVHAAIGRFLTETAAELATASTPPAAWACVAPGAHWFARGLLEAIPGLHYLHVYRAGLTMASAVPGDELAELGPVALARDDAGTSPYWGLKYWVASQREALALREQFPGRVTLVDVDAHRDAGASPPLRWLEALGVPAESLRHVPADLLRWGRTPVAASLDLAQFDPLDLQFLAPPATTAAARRA